MRPLLPLAALLLLTLALPLVPAQSGTCFPQSTHTYVMGASANLIVQNTAETRAAGGVVVHDTNVNDCDGDGVPGDFDRDWDFGVGGGYFPFNHHAAFACVQDVIWGSTVAFVMAFDGDGDGAILPGIDPDDQVFGPFVGCGGAWGDGCAHVPAGGDPNLHVEGVDLPPVPNPLDGPSAQSHCPPPLLNVPTIPGFWIFIQGSSVVVDAQGNVFVSNPPVMGTITTA